MKATDFDTRMQALITQIRGDGYTNYLVADRMWPFSWTVWNDPLNATYQGFHHYANERSLSMAISRMEDARAAGITKIMNTETGAHYSEYTYYTQSLVDQYEAFLNWSYALASPIFNCVWMRENIENWATYVYYDLDLPVMPPPPVVPPSTLPPYLLSHAINDTHEYRVANFTASWNASAGLSTGWLTHNLTGSWVNLTQTLTGTVNATFNQVITLPAHGIVIGYYLGANDTTNNVTQSELLYFTVATEEYTLTISIIGSGSVTRNSTGVYHYPGSYVNLTAIPGTGYIFSAWSGSLTGSTNPVTIFMNVSKSITATFLSTGYVINLTRGFQVVLPDTGSMRFQRDTDSNVLITASSNFDTGASCTLTMNGDSGIWTFGNIGTSSLTVSFFGNVGPVYVNGETSGNGTEWNFASTSTNTISWNWVPPGETIAPLIPIAFIIGMTGLGSLFVGPIYGITLIRKKEYKNGFIWAVILTALGFALFISWLWH